MFKIIGADGKEYGPVSLDQLRQWMSEGRVNLQTKVLPEGTTEWISIAQVPELAGATPPPPPSPGVFQAAPTYGNEDAAAKVKGPAIFILVLAILDVLASIVGMIMMAAGNTMMKFPGMPEPPPEQLAMQQKMMALFSLPSYIIGLLVAIFCIFGALRMMKLKGYGIAMTTAILTLLPCGACCCLLNLGAGIWALVVLNKPEVKSSFS